MNVSTVSILRRTMATMASILEMLLFLRSVAGISVSNFLLFLLLFMVLNPNKDRYRSGPKGSRAFRSAIREVSI
jgi:hypothetical protein